MDKRIVKFLKTNKVLTIATAVDNKPYCASCFYVFDEENKLLIFLSDKKTKHIYNALINEKVAGTINQSINVISKIKGIQFKGKFINPDGKPEKQYYHLYFEKFPFSKVIPSPIWAIALTWIKMTDNTLGFGKKLIWEK